MYVCCYLSCDCLVELDLDILEDIVEEAEEINRFNPWLNYGEPLHRLREFGVTLKELDLLDEAALAPEHVSAVIRIMYVSSLPLCRAEYVFYPLQACRYL